MRLVEITFTFFKNVYRHLLFVVVVGGGDNESCVLNVFRKSFQKFIFVILGIVYVSE